MEDAPQNFEPAGGTRHPPCLPSPIPVATPMQIIYSIKIRHVPKDPGSTIHIILNPADVHLP